MEIFAEENEGDKNFMLWPVIVTCWVILATLLSQVP